MPGQGVSIDVEGADPSHECVRCAVQSAVRTNKFVVEGEISNAAVVKDFFNGVNFVGATGWRCVVSFHRIKKVPWQLY